MQLGGPQSRSTQFQEKRKSLPLAGVWTPATYFCTLIMDAAEIHSQPQHPTLTPMEASKHRSNHRTKSPQPHNSSQKKLDNSTDPSSNLTLNRTRQTTVSVLQSPVYSFYLSIVSAPFRMYLQILWFPQSSQRYSGLATDGLQSRQRFATLTRKRFASNWPQNLMT